MAEEELGGAAGQKGRELVRELDSQPHHLGGGEEDKGRSSSPTAKDFIDCACRRPPPKPLRGSSGRAPKGGQDATPHCMETGVLRSGPLRTLSCVPHQAVHFCPLE